MDVLSFSSPDLTADDHTALSPAIKRPKQREYTVTYCQQAHWHTARKRAAKFRKCAGHCHKHRLGGSRIVGNIIGQKSTIRSTRRAAAIGSL
ncbi:hypothetical protein [Nocardia sp. CA-120079]|uniref:hypothetical protein n=1 Tax=Nocardia sp. CA-120079 TaxID=3239974 RepID=UPI003D96F493